MKLHSIIACFAVLVLTAACSMSDIESTKAPNYHGTPHRLLIVSRPEGKVETRTLPLANKLLAAVKSCGIEAMVIDRPHADAADMNEKMYDDTIAQTMQYYQLDSLLELRVTVRIRDPQLTILWGKREDYDRYHYQLTLMDAAGTNLWRANIKPTWDLTNDGYWKYFPRAIIESMKKDGVLPQNCTVAE